MFRSLALLIFFAAFPMSSFAEIDTRSMSCSDVAALVASKQSVILTYARGRAGIFVRNSDSCAFGLYAVVAMVPTLDRAYCQVGYRCGEPITTEYPAAPSTKSDSSGDSNEGGGVTVGGASLANPPKK